MLNVENTTNDQVVMQMMHAKEDLQTAMKEVRGLMSRLDRHSLTPEGNTDLAARITEASNRASAAVTAMRTAVNVLTPSSTTPSA